MIERLAIKGFKGLADVHVPSRDTSVRLGPLTVLVGPNSCGKTSVLQAIERLCALNAPTPNEFTRTTSRLGDVFGGTYAPENLRTRGYDGEISLHAQFAEGKSITVDLSPSSPAAPYGRYAVALFGANGLESQAQFPGQSGRSEFWNERGIRALGRAAYYQLDPFQLRAPSYTESAPTLGMRGENLPSVLANVASTDRDLLQRIEEDLRRVVPACRRIRTPHSPVMKVETQTVTINGQTSVTLQNNTYGGNRLEVEIAEAGFLGADLLSEGTLIVLGLLTALHTSPGRSIFLLDDIERALHPSAQKELVASLRRFLKHKPETQVVCTSHSPYIIDHFGADEVCVMRADPRAHAVCQRLVEHPEWIAWKGQLEPGEFWTSVGENWVET